MNRFMSKSKKSPKTKKSVVVFIYGPVAVGKLTIAKILSKKLNFKLIHNHQINDFADSVFTPHTFESNYAKEHLRYTLPEIMIKAGHSVVLTHTYRSNYVSRTGLSDPKYVKTLQNKLIKAGAKFFPVHLQADHSELLKRIKGASRKDFRKLMDKKIMMEYLQKLDFTTTPNLKDNLVIDNTNLSPKTVADMIISNFKLK
jgi:deoxyadenosine/deoxycytidine kinase